MEVFSTPDEFFVGKPLNKGVFYGTAVSSAATSDVLFFDNAECFFYPFRGGITSASVKRRILPVACLAPRFRAAPAPVLPLVWMIFAGGIMRVGVRSVEPSLTTIISRGGCVCSMRA